MSLDRHTLFALIRSSVWGENMYPFDRSIQADWPAIYDELCVQTIDSLAVDILSSVDTSLQMRYLQNTGSDLMFWYRIMEMQQELYSLLQTAGIPFVILKGAAAAVYYPQPCYRRMGDIDVLVKPEDYKAAIELLQLNKYLLADEDEWRHSALIKDGIHIELHQNFSLFNDPKPAQILDDLLHDAMNHAQITEMEHYTFPMLPALENGIVLLSHIGQHLETGLGLRQVIDWMLYVHHVLDDSMWQKAFHPMIQQLGLESLAITVTRMCQLYLGLGSQITWCRSADTATCRNLMNLIIERGNFGRKGNSVDSQSLNTVLFMQSPISFLKYLQGRGCHNWNALKKHPWLKPFAWFYQICRYARFALSRKNPVRSLKNDFEKKHQYDNLLNQLGATRWGKGIASPGVKQ